MIFSINTRSHVLYSVAKNSFDMSDDSVYQMIQAEYKIMLSRLSQKGINYCDLKTALVPNQNKKKHELCLVFDSQLISADNYGAYLFDKILPLLNKESTYSVLYGDYIDVLHDGISSQLFLKQALYEILNVMNPSKYIHSTQYFLVYFNSTTNGQAEKIISKLKSYEWFHGYAYLDNDTVFKSYISSIIGSLCIKYKSVVISSHPSDYKDNEDVNIKDYPYEENGFRFVSINEESYLVFLEYKIESVIKDSEDEGFSFNALFPKFDSIDKLKLIIKDDKFDYLCYGETGKPGIIKSLGFDGDQKDEFRTIIYNKICEKHIFNMELNEYGIYKFNVCVNMLTQNGHYRKTTIALKYISDTGEIEVITIT